MYFAPHTHTKRSDGLIEPADALRFAAERGFTAYSITDHDTIAAYSDPPLINFMKRAEESFRLIPGVELTALLDTSERKFSDVELIGYLFDIEAKPITEACLHNQAIRHDWTRVTLDKINDFFEFSGSDRIDEEYIRVTNSENISSIGKPHIVKSLLLKPKVQRWLDSQKKISELEEETFASDKAAIEAGRIVPSEVRLKVRTEYLYSMFKSPDESGYKPIAGEFSGVFFSPKIFLSVGDAIAAIRESGGLVQIPHPFVSAKRLGMKVKDFLRLFADHFRNRSIIGLETDYPILDKYLKYYSDYRFGKSKFRDSTKTGAYLLSNEEKAIVTIKEMQEIANEDMHKYLYWLATDPDLDLGFLISELIHFRVSDCHFRKGDDLMHYCSGESECRHLLELKKRLT